MSSTQAFVVQNKDSGYELKDVPLRELGAQEVRVKIECSGLCHTDVHMAKNEWGITAYPTVPGHEGVGYVTAVGAAVKALQVGQKVGIGWMCASCEGCDKCIIGDESVCRSGYQGTYLPGTEMGGTFAKEVTIGSRFCFPVPETIPSALAAPLLCAGITVYAPLRRYVKPNHKVGIISIGGLGHLAIQFARALGAEVTVFSTSKRKEADAKKFGASHFVVFTDEEEFKKSANTMDVILNTCPYTIPLDGFVDALAADGVLIYVGLPEAGESELKINLYKLVFGQKTLAGSIVGGSRYMKEMFEMVEKFGISSSVTCVDFSTLNETSDKLIAGDMNGSYRYCLCWEDAAKLQKEADDYFARK